MSLLRPGAAKIFHQISKRQPTVPLSTTTNNENFIKPSRTQSSRPINRPKLKTKRSVPKSRQSRRAPATPKPRLEIDLINFGDNLPAIPHFDLDRERWQQGLRCGPAERPFIGASTKLRTRRLMTPATPMTPMTTIRAMASEDRQLGRPPLPMLGVSSLRSRRPKTPKTPGATMGYEMSISQGFGFSSAPKINRAASSLTPLTSMFARASVGPSFVQTRTFTKAIDCTEKIMRKRKPCFSVKKLPPKKKPIDWTSPCACDYQKKNLDRCLKWKCRPSFCPCKKPPSRTFRCPKRVKKIRMRKLATKKRKIRLGYKVCVKPPKINEPFWCFPKPPPPPPPPEPTPKRCPCFKPQELQPPPPCKKVRCAVDGDCKKKPRKLDISCPCRNTN